MKTNHPLLGQPTEVEIVDDSHEPWLLVRCKQTNFHFIANPPTYERLSEEFAWEKTLDQERKRRHREEPVVSNVSDIAKKLKFLIRPNRDKMFESARRVIKGKSSSKYRVLDVGCGNGKYFSGFCERFQKIGIEIVPIGIEVSSRLAAISRRRLNKFGGDVILDNAISGMTSVQPGSIDIVTMLSFLEHEAQPLPLLKAICTALKPDGAVILKVPNFGCWNRYVRGRKWAGYRFPDHVSYFTSATLQLLAEQTGFELLPQRFTDCLPTNDNMYAIMKRRQSVDS